MVGSGLFVRELVANGSCMILGVGLRGSSSVRGQHIVQISNSVPSCQPSFRSYKNISQPCCLDMVNVVVMICLHVIPNEDHPKPL